MTLNCPKMSKKPCTPTFFGGQKILVSLRWPPPPPTLCLGFFRCIPLAPGPFGVSGPPVSIKNQTYSSVILTFLLGGTHGHARGPPRPSWKVYNICWGFAATLLGRLIVYDGSMCQILVSYYESSNFSQVMDISCHWVEATNLLKLNLLCTHVIRSWCNTQWNLKLKDEGLIFVERCDMHLQPQGLTGTQCLT